MLLEGVSLAVLPAAWASPCMRPFEGCSHPCVSAVCVGMFSDVDYLTALSCILHAIGRGASGLA